jgi:hypothetical protein
MLFISNCITGPKHESNGKRSLCRFQFLDALIGLAEAKYVTSGLCDNKAAALEKTIMENIYPYADRDDPTLFILKFLAKICTNIQVHYILNKG